MPEASLPPSSAAWFDFARIPILRKPMEPGAVRGGAGTWNPEPPRLDGPGELLPAPLRERLQPAVPAELGAVRVHHDASAARAATAAGAEAFTLGQHIAFSEGSYRPDSSDGLRLLTHELTHVAQHQAGRVPSSLPNGRRISQPDDALEREASAASHSLAVVPSTAAGRAPAAAGASRAATGAPGVILRQQKTGDDETIDLGYGLVLHQWESQSLATLSYKGVPWATYTWAPKKGRKLKSLQIERAAAEGKGAMRIRIDAEFEVNVTIDRTAEQSASDTSMSDVRVIHDYHFSGKVSVQGTDGKIVKGLAPTKVTNDYVPRTAAEGNERAPEGYLRLGGAMPTKLEARVWSFDTQERYDAFVSTHPDTMWAEIVTKDGAHIAYALTPEALARIAAKVRRADKQHELLERYPGGYLGSVAIQGVKLGSLNELANLYYRSDSEARDGTAGSPEECEVFEQAGVYYGRKPLEHHQALARWRELDKLTYDGILKAETEPGRKFHALFARGSRKTHRIDWVHYQAREELLKNADAFNEDVRVVDTTIPDDPGMKPLRHYIANAQRMGPLMEGYLLTETDRTDGGDPKFRELLKNKPRLAESISDVMMDEVESVGQNIALTQLRNAVKEMRALGGSPDVMGRFVRAFPALSEEKKQQTLGILGLPEADQEAARKTLSDPVKAGQISLGLLVDRVSIPTLSSAVLTRAGEIEAVIEQLRSFELIAVRAEGDIGVQIRNQTYKAMGFRRLKGDTYPHGSETQGLFPFAMSGDTADFTNVAEQMWANRVAHMDHASTMMKIAGITAAVAASVVMILIANAAGAAAAGALFAEGTFAFAATELVVSAATLTALEQTANAALSGKGPEAGDVAKDFGKNLLVLGGFKVLNAILTGIAKAGVSFVVGGEEALAASKLGQKAVSGIRLAGVTAAFIELSLIHFKSAHGRDPNTEETALLLYENLLTIALLEVGAGMARPLMERIGVWAEAHRLGEYKPKIDAMFAGLKVLQTDIASVTSKPGGDVKPLISRQRALLEQQRALVEELKAGKKISGDAKQVEKMTDLEIQKIDMMLDTLRHAEFLSATRLMPTQTPDVMTYTPGTEQKIRDFYGKQNVKGPDAKGELKVTRGGQRITLRPEKGATPKPGAAAKAAPASEASGAVLGGKVYKISQSVQIETGKPSLEAGVDVAMSKVPGASVTKTPGGSGTASVYEMRVNTSAGTFETVKVTFEAQASLGPGSHGTDSGPARVALAKGPNGWEAKVRVREGVMPEDVKHIAAHEFAEVARIIHDNPNASPAEVQTQMEAGLFQPGKTGLPKPHDFGASVELRSFCEELSAEQKSSSPDQNKIKAMKARIERMLKAMGLDYADPSMDPREVKLRLDSLRVMGLPRELDLQLRAEVETRASNKRRGVGLGGSAVELTVDRVRHTLYPEDNKGSFPKKGVGGGHLEPELRRFLKEHPEYHLEEVAQKPLGSATARKFEQYRHKSGGPPPAGEQWGAKPGNPDWVPAMDANNPGQKLYKTTVSNAEVLLDEGASAWENWVTTAAPLATKQVAWGPANSKNGQFSGYANPVLPGPHWIIVTMYPEATWF